MSGLRRLLLIGLASALAVATGCTTSAPKTADAPTPRIVSLTPAITETVAALGARDSLVARSDWCALPPEVTALPAAGSGLTPDLERIAGLAPTAVLLDDSGASRTTDLQAVAPVTVLPWLTADEISQSIRRLGPLLDRPTAADALADRFAALPDGAPDDGPVVLVSLTTDPAAGEVWFVKRNSLHGTLLHAAGARNAVDRDLQGPPRLSLEALVALDPAVIVVLSALPADEATRRQITAQWSVMDGLGAVREGRLAILGGPEVLSTGPAALELVPPLRAAIASVDSR